MESQYDAITRVFLDETRDPSVQAMVGLISLSLPAIIERIERARAMGARRFQLSLPSWGALRDAEMETFFRETCGRFPDCEFLHYNLARAGRILTGTEYGRLAVEYPNLVATKNSTADEARLESLPLEAPQLRHFITEVGFAKASRLGECGLLISFASSNPARAQRYFRAAGARDWATLDALQAELDAILPALKQAGAGGAHMDGAFDKMFLRLHDPAFPLRLLPPYTAVTEEIFAGYAERLRIHHPQWLP
jgi:dihydrodipicolinate synthase/N-acetylneuraminate lyase